MSESRIETQVLAGALVLSLATSALAPAGLCAEALPVLPEGIASFGGAVAGDDLYVFGGHVGETHQHSIENLSHRFLRLDLTAPEKGWQEVGEAVGLQGLPMVAHGGRVCRVGGLSARNHVGTDEDLVSVAEVACFDPATGSWQALPDLPRPRSSHDAVVAGDHLYVVGGWQLRGAGNEAAWHDTMAVLDLSAAEPAWQSIPQPFQRRALAAATAGGKIYAFGGLGTDGTSRRVDVYDPESGAWSGGPELPAMATKRMKGFGVSAFGIGDRVYLSGADGVIHALAAGADAWDEGLGRLATPRFFHRLLPHGDRLLFVAGAARSGHLDTTEAIALANLAPGSVVQGDRAATAVAEAVDRGTWPGFRGHGDGRAPFAEVPVRWSDEEGPAWRAALPGFGQSAPVVWGRQVFVTSVEGPNKGEVIASALDLDSGEVRWRRRFDASQKIESSDMVSRGAPTPAVDGERVYAFWESGDLIALGHDGETLWRRSLTADYGDFAGNHGVASSPVLTGDAVVIQVTHEGPSYFLAVDKATGENRWKVDRPAAVAWTTPVVVEGPAGAEIVSSAAGRVEALSAAAGEQLWVLEGIEKNHVPSASVVGELVVVASSEAGNNLAVRRGGHGELSAESVVWRAEGVTSGFGSPVVQGGCVLFTNKAGVVTCIDPASGEEHWQHRLPDAAWASPIVAGDNVFYFTKKGRTAVLSPSPEGPGVVAENRLATEGTVYGAAAVRGAILVRSGSELVRIGKDPIAEPPASETTVVAQTH